MDTILILMLVLAAGIVAVRTIAPFTKTKKDDELVKALEMIEPYVLAHIAKRQADSAKTTADAAIKAVAAQKP